MFIPSHSPSPRLSSTGLERKFQLLLPDHGEEPAGPSRKLEGFTSYLHLSLPAPVRNFGIPRLTSGTRPRKPHHSKKPLDNDTADDESLNDLEFDTLPSPSTERHRRGITMQKRSYVESDADSGEEEVFTPKSKKVKSEPVDDEDESGMSKTEGELEDDDEGISFV